MATQQQWVTTELGGTLTNNRLSKQMREQAAPKYVFRQFCDIKEQQGLHNGDTTYFVKEMMFDTAMTRVSETNVSQTGLVKWIKGSATVSEWSMKVPYTGKLEALAEWDVTNRFHKSLLTICKKSFDGEIATIFKTAKFKAVCTNTATTVFYTNGTATIVSTAQPSDKNIRDIVDYMESKHIPYYQNGSYYNAILSIGAMRGVYDYLEAKAQYVKPPQEYNFEQGSYYNCRFIKDTATLSNAIGSGSAYGEGIVFGNESVIELISILEEIRSDPVSDNGRSKAIGVYALLDWAKMWDLATDDLNSTGKGIERIVHITSA